MGTASGYEEFEFFEPATVLWILAFLFFGVGDTATTTIGLTIGSSSEANPFVASLIESYGIGVLVPLKAALLGCCYLGWKRLPIPYPVVIPAVLAVMGIVVTIWNTGILLTGSFSL